MPVEQHSIERNTSEVRDPGYLTRSSALVASLHLGFVLTGIVNTMLGPLLPFLSARWQLNDLHAGNLFVAQFLGSMVGVTGSSLLIPRKGSRFVLAFGLLMMAAGAAGLAVTSWSTGLVPFTLVGIGLGLGIPTTNLLISELYASKRAAGLNLINLSWGVGAVICPFVIAALQQTSGTVFLLYGVAVLDLALVLILMQIAFPVVQKSTRGDFEAGALQKMWHSRYVPILGAIFFLYVGTEASVGGWIASYAQRAMPSGTIWVLTPSFFWASLLLGRSAAPMLLHRIRENRLSRFGLITALLGLGGCLAASNTGALAIATGFAGLGLSAVFPIAIAALSHKFGEMTSRVAGLMFNLAGLGGATLPWLVGLTSTHTGNLKFGLFVPFLGCAAMLLLNLLLEPRTKPVSAVAA